MTEVEALRASAKFRARGRNFDELKIGEPLPHHWGRTITEAEAIQFSTLTLSYNPLYFNREYAIAHGHPDIVVNPLLVFNVVLGMSVEDCAEGTTGPFLGVRSLTHHEPVYPGDTLTSTSTTIEKRITEGDPDKGVIAWHMEGFNQNGIRVIDFKRSNLSDFKLAKLMREGRLA